MRDLKQLAIRYIENGVCWRGLISSIKLSSSKLKDLYNLKIAHPELEQTQFSEHVSAQLSLQLQLLIALTLTPIQSIQMFLKENLYIRDNQDSEQKLSIVL